MNDIVPNGPYASVSEEWSFLLGFARKVGQVACRTRGHFLCPICNEPLNNPSIIPCGHIFCMTCVCNWFEGQNNCPCCRYPITGKDLSGENAVLAKVFSDVSPNMASVFNAGNFCEKLEDEFQDEPLQDALPTLSTSQTNSANSYLTRMMAPICRRIFDDKKNSSNEKDKKRQNGLDFNYVTAIWLLRQCYILQASENDVTLPRDDTRKSHSTNDDNNNSFFDQLPTLICLEAFKGTDSSRESFLKRVMSSKSSNADKHPGGYNIPQTSGSVDFKTNSSSSNPVGHPPQIRTRIRFRAQSWQSIYKMIFITIAFITLSLTVHLFEDAAQRLSRRKGFKVDLNKLDFIVYAALLIVVISHCETAAVGGFRRQAGGNNDIRRRRRNRRRRRDLFDDLNFS